MKNSAQHPPYTVLAHIYDTLMQDVDYETWSDFIDEILQVYHPDPYTILELACGTGSLAFKLGELECYKILATDKSPEMIKRAREKNDRLHHSIEFRTMDFLNIDLDNKFDAVISTFDSVNYLEEPWDVLKMLREVKKVLTPQSIFVFDFTTPKNSREAIDFLDNEKGYTGKNYRFRRKSRFDAEKNIHYNEFKIEKIDTAREKVVDHFHEVHTQKIYTLNEMLDIIGQTDYQIIAALDNFSFAEAGKQSSRVTMVLQCPTIPL